ncbi:hypothetical protein SUNI508_02477 [Seiridium unicorne]|uniref:BED-type domain-containing protein n=1 Tax=Seiridium unicorne TaxID=138068 RepID=A0ABR2UFK8_9PEZI
MDQHATALLWTEVNDRLQRTSSECREEVQKAFDSIISALERYTKCQDRVLEFFYSRSKEFTMDELRVRTECCARSLFTEHILYNGRAKMTSRLEQTSPCLGTKQNEPTRESGSPELEPETDLAHPPEQEASLPTKRHAQLQSLFSRERFQKRQVSGAGWAFPYPQGTENICVIWCNDCGKNYISGFPPRDPRIKRHWMKYHGGIVNQHSFYSDILEHHTYIVTNADVTWANQNNKAFGSRGPGRPRMNKSFSRKFAAEGGRFTRGPRGNQSHDGHSGGALSTTDIAVSSPAADTETIEVQTPNLRHSNKSPDLPRQLASFMPSFDDSPSHRRRGGQDRTPPLPFEDDERGRSVEMEASILTSGESSYEESSYEESSYEEIQDTENQRSFAESFPTFVQGAARVLRGAHKES